MMPREVDPRKSGIYALFRLDGGPVDGAAKAALGSAMGGAETSDLIELVDSGRQTALHRHSADGVVTVMAGDIEEPEALAKRLGLATSTPPALVARAALDKFGAQASTELIGEWSLLQRDRRRGTVTLMLSAARRDPLLFALSGIHLAVAPDIHRLAKLPWVGARLDEAGLLFALARGGVRAAGGDRTMVRGVRHIEPGGCVVVSSDGSLRTDRAEALSPPEPWRGTFEDAAIETEQLLRRIMRARLARAEGAGVLLSGGLEFFAARMARQRGARKVARAAGADLGCAARQRTCRRSCLRRVRRRSGDDRLP